MEMKKALNASCDFRGYLVCQMPDNVVQVELKIKATIGKYTLIKDIYTRTERYHPWDRADRRFHKRRKRTPHHENKDKDNARDSSVSIDSGTDIPNRKGFGYPHTFLQIQNQQLN